MYEFNDRIYDKKWQTKENKEYAKKAKSFLELRAPLYSRVPDSWAKEVYELLMLWEKQHGITITDSKYFNSYDHSFSFKGLKIAVLAYFRYLKKKPTKFDPDKKQALWDLKRDLAIFTVLFRKTLGKLINIRKKPGIHITQLKEKYGRLVIYWEATNKQDELFIKDMVKYDIKRVSEELTAKGVYNNE